MIPMCFYCSNLLGISDKQSCLAFPDGIPENILSGETSHKDNIDGDHGFKFELNEEDELLDEQDTISSPIVTELDRIKSEIESGNVTSRTIVALQYIIETLKTDMKTPEETEGESENIEDVKENTRGIIRNIPIEHEMRKEGEADLQSIEDDIINELRHAGYFKLTKDEK